MISLLNIFIIDIFIKCLELSISSINVNEKFYPNLFKDFGTVRFSSKLSIYDRWWEILSLCSLVMKKKKLKWFLIYYFVHTHTINDIYTYMKQPRNLILYTHTSTGHIYIYICTGHVYIYICTGHIYTYEIINIK